MFFSNLLFNLFFNLFKMKNLIFFSIFTLCINIEIKITLPYNDTFHNYTIINDTQLNPKFNLKTILKSSSECQYNNYFFYEKSDELTTNFSIITNDTVNKLQNVELRTNNKNLMSYYFLNPKHNNEEYELKIKTKCKKEDIIDSNYKLGEYYPLKTTHKEYNNNENYAILKFSFLYKEKKYVFSYLKFCSSEGIYLSIISSSILFIIALIYLILSTNYQLEHKIIQEMNEEMDIKWWHGIIFIILGSCVLLIFYFFFNYIINIINILVAIESFICLQFAFDFLIEKKIKEKRPNLLKKKYIFNMKLSNILSIIISLLLVLLYLYKKHWILNNIMAFGLVFTILSIILFKSFKVCFFFLLFIFLYDTFWVFYSEKIFKGNVMEEVATKLSLPIKLEIPILFSTNPIKDCMLLGLGDIALPGMVVKYCKTFDEICKKLNKKNGYYNLSIYLYIISVLTALICVFYFEHGQPVLFYISPAFIFGLMSKSFYLNQLSDFWNGIELPKQNDNNNNNDKDSNNNSHNQELHKINEGEKLEMVN